MMQFVIITHKLDFQPFVSMVYVFSLLIPSQVLIETC